MPFTSTHRELMRQQDWNDQRPPRDPTLVAANAGRQHYNQATGTTLFPQNAMPVGYFAGRTMTQVPAAYLLYIASFNMNREAPTHRLWHPVCDFVDRFHHELTARAQTETWDLHEFLKRPNEDIRPRQVPKGYVPPARRLNAESPKLRAK